MGETLPLNPKIAQLPSPWRGQSHSILLATSLTLKRNIETFLFPSKINPDKRNQLFSLILKELNSFMQPYVALKGEEMAPLDKEYLMEHFLSLESFQHVHSGEGFLFDEEARLLTAINLKDHIKFTYTDYEGELEKSWEAVAAIENELGQRLDYAYSPQFGFLTSDPHSCGTGLHIAVYLQLPALHQTKKLPEIIKKLIKEETILVTGLQASPLDFVGDVVVVQNKKTLGVTEETLIASIRAFSAKLQTQEENARCQIRDHSHPEIKDHVSRAFGALVHSYQLEAAEALDNLSLLKLGCLLGWVENVDVSTINDLFFSCRRAHLICRIGLNKEDGVPPERLLHSRAEYLHSSLSQAKLTI